MVIKDSNYMKRASRQFGFMFRTMNSSELFLCALSLGLEPLVLRKPDHVLVSILPQQHQDNTSKTLRFAFACLPSV